MWSPVLLQEAENFLERLRRNLSREEVAPTSGVVQLLIAAISDDLNTPSALKTLEVWCEETESGLTGGQPGELSRAIDSLLGIAF
jgi:L-cysteine:1D-myo-inositol 2-amino-2-deoxy-alpha-D-glucopyranoside ligase